MADLRQPEAKAVPPTEYLIYFVDKDVLHWWDYVFHTRVGFRHCFVLCWDEWSQRWLLVDWRRRKLDMMILFDFERDELIEALCPAKLTVIKFTTAIELEDEQALFVSYCSNLLGRLLGLGNTLILTPYQLYRKLLDAGGEVEFDWRIHDGCKNSDNNLGTEEARTESD